MKKTMMAIIALTLGTSAYAQSSTAAATTSETSTSSTWSRIKANTNLKYYGEAYNNRMNSDEGQKGEENELYNVVSLRNKLTNEIGLRADARFILLLTDETVAGAERNQYTAMNPRFYITHKTTNNGLGNEDSLRFEPVVTGSAANTTIGKVRYGKQFDYTVNNVHTIAGGVLLYKYIYTKKEVETGNDFMILPNIGYTYQATDKLSLSVYTELVYVNKFDDEFSDYGVVYEGESTESSIYADYAINKAVVVGTGVYGNTGEGTDNIGARLYVSATLF